jgi:cell division protein FtsI/penicillin-binding protein 2
MRWRVWFIRIIFVLGFVAIGTNLYFVQVNRSGNLVTRVQAQNDSTGALASPRGLIFATDKNGNTTPLVLNKDYPTIYAVPIEIQDPKEAAAVLAPIVNKDMASLVTSLSKPKSQYALLIEKATDDEVQKIEGLNLKGIYIRNKTYRAYPFGSMASQVLGFISSGSDGILAGRYGLEFEFNDQLSKPDAKDGSEDLYLTLDTNIQNEAEKLIADLNSTWKADGAELIVQEPSTGKILAMAKVPTFDPNEYHNYAIKDFLNPNVQLPYEPGSVFKIMTMAAGIDSGKITPDTTYVDTGCVKLDKAWTICNWDSTTHGAYGKITMTNVIEHSLNVGATFAEKQTGNSIFTDYVKKFGFGTKTGIELPGELAGNLNNLNNGESSNYATASYGQGITATPIQLVDAFSAVANGGVLMKPLLFAGEKPQVIRRVISQDTASKLTKMMVSAVNVNVVAKISQYNVAGKTGTAYTTDYNVKGYNKSQLINTYMGYAPASDPKFVILVKLDHPKNAPLAGETVVPVFRSMAEFLLNYYNIAPDNISVPAGQ